MADENILTSGQTGAGSAPAPSGGAQAQPVTPSGPTFDAEAEQRISARIEAKLRAEFEARSAHEQSIADRKRNEALRRAKLLDEIAPDLGMEPEQLAQIKRKVIDDAFYNDKPEPEADRQISLTQAAPAIDEDALELQRRKVAKKLFGLKGTELDAFLDESAKIMNVDPEAEQKWNSLGRKYMLAQAKREEQVAADAKKEQAADVVGEVKDAFGGLGGIQSPGTAPAYRPKNTLDDADDLGEVVMKAFREGTLNNKR